MALVVAFDSSSMTSVGSRCGELFAVTMNNQVAVDLLLTDGVTNKPVSPKFRYFVVRLQSTVACQSLPAIEQIPLELLVDLLVVVDVTLGIII